MKCPNCGKNSVSKQKAIFCSFDDPVVCGSCGKYFWTNRILTKVLVFLYLYSGAVFLVLLIAFLNGVLVGAFALATSVAIFYAVASFELWVIGLKEKDNHDISHSKSVFKPFKSQGG